MKKPRTKGRPASTEEIAASLAAFDLFAEDTPADEAAAPPTDAAATPAPEPPKTPSWDRTQPGGMTDEVWDIFAALGCPLNFTAGRRYAHPATLLLPRHQHGRNIDV